MVVSSVDLSSIFDDLQRCARKGYLWWPVVAQGSINGGYMGSSTERFIGWLVQTFLVGQRSIVWTIMLFMAPNGEQHWITLERKHVVEDTVLVPSSRVVKSTEINTLRFLHKIWFQFFKIFKQRLISLEIRSKYHFECLQRRTRIGETEELQGVIIITYFL